MATRTAIINVMAKSCYKVSRSLIRDFGEVEQLQVSRKGPRDFVSTANSAAAKKLIEDLSRARPDYGFVVKDNGTIKTRDPKNRRWMIDPLSGTGNFLHGIPHWAISIGLEEESELVAGVIYDPTRDELFWAEKGVGAYLNDKRIRVSERRDLTDCLIAAGTFFDNTLDNQQYSPRLQLLATKTADIRHFGPASLDLAYVAAGRCDGFWKNQVKPWDIAAGIIIVKEAGGYISDSAGSNCMMSSGDIVAANSKIHHLLLKLFEAS